MSLFSVSIAFSLLKKIARNIYFSCFFFKYEMWWYYLSLLALHLNQLLLTIFIIKNQELYSSFYCSEKLKKRKEEKLQEKNIYLNILQIVFFCSINKIIFSYFWIASDLHLLHLQFINELFILEKILEFFQEF